MDPPSCASPCESPRLSDDELFALLASRSRAEPLDAPLPLQGVNDVLAALVSVSLSRQEAEAVVELLKAALIVDRTSIVYGPFVAYACGLTALVPAAINISLCAACVAAAVDAMSAAAETQGGVVSITVVASEPARVIGLDVPTTPPFGESSSGARTVVAVANAAGSPLLSIALVDRFSSWTPAQLTASMRATHLGGHIVACPDDIGGTQLAFRQPRRMAHVLSARVSAISPAAILSVVAGAAPPPGGRGKALSHEDVATALLEAIELLVAAGNGDSFHDMSAADVATLAGPCEALPLTAVAADIATQSLQLVHMWSALPQLRLLAHKSGWDATPSLRKLCALACSMLTDGSLGGVVFSSLQTRRAAYAFFQLHSPEALASWGLPWDRFLLANALLKGAVTPAPCPVPAPLEPSGLSRLEEQALLPHGGSIHERNRRAKDAQAFERALRRAIDGVPASSSSPAQPGFVGAKVSRLCLSGGEAMGKGASGYGGFGLFKAIYFGIGARAGKQVLVLERFRAQLLAAAAKAPRCSPVWFALRSFAVGGEYVSLVSEPAEVRKFEDAVAFAVANSDIREGLDGQNLVFVYDVESALVAAAALRDAPYGSRRTLVLVSLGCGRYVSLSCARDAERKAALSAAARAWEPAAAAGAAAVSPAAAAAAAAAAVPTAAASIYTPSLGRATEEATGTHVLQHLRGLWT